MEAIIRSGEVPGLLAYLEGESIGWCSVAPREAFPVDPGTSGFDAGGSFTGLIPTFGKAGFKEVARRSKRRAVLRLSIPIS